MTTEKIKEYKSEWDKKKRIRLYIGSFSARLAKLQKSLEVLDKKSEGQIQSITQAINSLVEIGKKIINELQ